MSKKAGAGQGSRVGQGRIEIEDAAPAQPKDYVALFRQKVEEKRETAPAIELEFDGIPLVVRRMQMAGWLRAGRMPDYFAAIYIAENQQAAQEQQKRPIKTEEVPAILAFQEVVVRESVVLPKIVFEDRPLASDEISYTEFSLSNTAAIEALVMWQMAGAPGIPVAMKGGETAEISDLENFREKPKRVSKRGNLIGTTGLRTKPTPRNL
jgi:hypothetical protein